MAISLLLTLAFLPAYIILRRIYYTLIYPSFSTTSTDVAPRPPLVADWIPFVGSGIAMTNGDTFWQGAVEKYGPAFRVRAMGDIRTFVVTPGVRLSLLESKTELILGS